MVDIVVSVASKVAEYLVAPVGRQCGYVIFSNSYVGQLREELYKLENTRQRVQHSINEAQSNMKMIEAEVQKWVKEVETIANKASDVLDYDGRAKETCLCRWLPNPKKRYCLGRDARKTVQAIQALILQGKFERVYYESAPPGHVTGASNVNSSVGYQGTPDVISSTVDPSAPNTVGDRGAPDVNSSAGDGGDTITVSRTSILQGIMKALGDEQRKVIGVYGPGGVGKTTLLKEVENVLREEKRPFDTIIQAKVSQTPDLNNIQSQIADGLSLNLKNKQSQQGRRDLLLRRLQNNPNKKVLIILDDLWEELDLSEVGIPSEDKSMGCKVLLASRSKDVLKQMMCASPIFHLKGLEDDEAFRLFAKIVGNGLKDDEDVRAIAPQVIKKLAGLPLLIKSVAATLKDSDVSAWRNALIKIDDSKMGTVVKLSYNHLKSEKTKSLFLLCGLIGGTIQAELLLILGMALGLFEGSNNTMQDSRDRMNIMLDSLYSICLLQDGGDDKENVTIHNLYSEVVVSTPFRDQFSLMINGNYDSWPKEKLENCWVCLVNVGSDRLVELMRCGFPDLKIFISLEQQDMGYSSKLDFSNMKELRVLYFCSIDSTSLPSSIEILRNLQSLYLDNCDMKDVAILGKLKALQILSFARSTISRLPKEIGDLTNLRSLNLSECYFLKIIEPGVLKGLINLEELHMQRSFDRWMGKDDIPSESSNGTIVELKCLTKLTSLEISIPDPTLLLEDGDLPFGNLIRFWINVGNVDGREFKDLRTMKLKLEGCNSILSREWVQKTLHKTQYLYLEGLRESKKNANELCTKGFPHLKHLHIQNSPSIKHIARSSEDLPAAFMKLEFLSIKNLINLEKICHGPVTSRCFSKLKSMRVIKCNQLNYLWCLPQIQRPVQLEEIEVRECDSMRAIVTYFARKDTVDTKNRVELHNVRRLELVNLPKMASFCIEVGITSEGTPIQVSLPRLESVIMIGLIGLEKILYSEPSLKYSNLKSLEIRESQSTSSILTSDWALKLPNLESMTIASSPAAEVVFDLEELKVTEDAEILSRLKTLDLWSLPNLRHLWKQDEQLQGISRFRSLEELNVSHTRLSFLFPVSMAKCLGEIRVIQVWDCPNMKAVIVAEEGRDEGTDDIIEFPLLKRLYICNCPMEKFFSYPHEKEESVNTSSNLQDAPSNSQDAYCDSFFDQKVSLPSLEDLHLNSVGSFKRIWHGELPRSSLCELASLDLRNCYELLNVFPSMITRGLHNLKIVHVESCPTLESLFDCGSLDANIEQTTILLPKLEKVTVRKGRKLRYLVKSDSQMILGFPRLKDVRVDNCSNLRYLFPSRKYGETGEFIH